MTTLKTAQFGSGTCPQAQLDVTVSSNTATTATLSWTLKWVTYGYTVSTSSARNYTVKINGSTVASGTCAINGKTSYTIKSGTVTITKGTAAKSIPLSLSFDMTYTWKNTYGGTKTASGSISVGAKTSYKISYNANGGSGAPSAQTKWHGTDIKLSTTKPSRTGYTFSKWNTNASGTGTSYNSGATYTANTAATLYAVWNQITYQVAYNANGGSGAPSAQTKKYGTALTLSTTKPTRTNYTFKGWATSSTGGVAYSAGGSYTANAKVTLYAVWELAYTKPVISNLKAVRCDSSGNLNETGTYAKVTFNWSTCTVSGNSATVSSILIGYGGKDYTSSVSVSGSGSSSSVSKIVGDGAFELDKSYFISATVFDSKNGSTSKEITLGGTKFPIDFKSGGSGVAIGKPAEIANVFDVNYRTIFRSGSDADGSTANSGYVIIGNPSGEHVTIDNNEIMAKLSGTTCGNLYIQCDGGWPCVGSDNAQVGRFAFRNEWIGLYSVYTDARNDANRKGWIGHNKTSDLTIDNDVSGGNIVLSPGGGGWAYIGSNTAQVGFFAFQNEWIGLYPSISNARNNTNRKGWIGHDKGDNLNIWNEVSGGDIYLSPATGGEVVSSKTIVSNGTFRLNEAYSTSTSLNCRWKDGLVHDIVNRGSDGLSSYIGPVSTSNGMKSVTNIRGYTVRLYNHGGGTYLGSSGSTAITSDKNLKKDIYDLSDKYVEFFMKLRPVTYKYNAKENIGHRDHLGYIAQEVEDALTASGLTTEQFAGICIEKDVTLDFEEDSSLTDKEREANKIHYDKLYSLRYEEFIALNTHMIQQAYKKIEEQQTEIDDLKARLSKLESMMGGLKNE